VRKTVTSTDDSV